MFKKCLFLYNVESTYDIIPHGSPGSNVFQRSLPSGQTRTLHQGLSRNVSCGSPPASSMFFTGSAVNVGRGIREQRCFTPLVCYNGGCTDSHHAWG